jgi:hypothetical protein
VIVIFSPNQIGRHTAVKVLHVRPHRFAGAGQPGTFCALYLDTGELLAATPMQLVGRPKLVKPLPKALPRSAVEAPLEIVAHDRNPKRQADWAERDLALIRRRLVSRNCGKTGRSPEAQCHTSGTLLWPSSDPPPIPAPALACGTSAVTRVLEQEAAVRLERFA